MIFEAKNIFEKAMFLMKWFKTVPIKSSIWTTETKFLNSKHICCWLFMQANARAVEVPYWYHAQNYQ